MTAAAPQSEILLNDIGTLVAVMDHLLVYSQRLQKRCDVQLSYVRA